MEKNSYVNRTYKDALFKKVFKDKQAILNLYNAIRKTHYTNAEAVHVNTIDRVVFLGMENDVSFIIDDILNIYEHQSTQNRNMPIRGLLYLAELYKDYIRENELDIYGNQRIQLPKPIYLVFYNGTEEQPDYEEIYLKDAFRETELPYSDFLDFKAVMLNINYGHNKELMERCRPLKEYAIFVDMIRKNLDRGMKIQQAAHKTVEKCLKKGILKDILLKEKGEIEDMITICYDEELHKRREAEYHEEVGEHRANLKIALWMKQKGMTKEEIKEATELELDEIEKL
ncbi:MAG: Rpn family recombination-promoting nuclease/putative transposase [Lachnospiraceae bacterium]|nr:Rpn family recombination-promoting nuclease/putative transposase [Lachnospiraceae bacterium]